MAKVALTLTIVVESDEGNHDEIATAFYDGVEALCSEKVVFARTSRGIPVFLRSYDPEADGQQDLD